MKTNLPVTQIEHEVNEDITLVSKTDLKGVITYANQELVDISGFTMQELLGSSHNIVRHPDMPPQAFEDLWATIKGGRAWDGIVKNRCKNGDYYWVHAHVTPIHEGKEITGYTSVRRRATRREIETAETAYQAMRAGKQVDLHREERSVLGRVPLKLRLILLLIFPILGLLYFSVGNVLDKSRNLDELTAMQTFASLAVKSSALIHEAQKERGMSAGFLSSNGEKFAAELPKQREATDKRLAELKELAASLDQSRLDPDFRATLEGALDKLKALNDTRAGISRLQLQPKDSFAYYTGLVGAWLDVISYTAKASTSQELGRATTAYLMFLKGKEMAGRERATVNGAFAADKFEWDTLQRFIALMADQKTYFALFQAYADEAEVAAYKDKVGPGVSNEVERLRQIALDKGLTGHFGVDPAQWFKAITLKIDAMKEVEDVLSEDLRNRASRLEADARRLMWLYLALTAGSLGAALIFGVWVIRVLLRELGGEPNYAREVARMVASGDLHVDIRTRPDDSSSLMAAIKNMKDSLAYMIHEGQKTSEEALRVKAALDNSTANVVIADTAGKVIYLNRAIQRLFRANEAAIRKALPGFSTDTLLGSPLDGLHQEPTLRHDTLLHLTEPQRAEIRLGELTFRLALIPVTDIRGKRVGTAVEWVDATQELKIQAEVQAMVEAALNGDFTHRIDLADKEGFMRDLSAGMNRLLETSETGLNEVLRVLEAIANGDLSQKIHNDYRGTFGQLKDYSNHTVEVLANIVSQLERVVTEANRGNFKVSIDAAGLSGFQLGIAEGINSLMKTSDVGLGEVLRVLGALSKGDLTETITNDYQGTFGQLKDYSNTTVESLKELVGRIKEAVDSINTAAKEIAAGNQDLSQRTEEQSSSLEETASSMEELTATVRHNADSAQQAGKLAVSASDIALKGGSVVQGSVQTMAEISNSSKKIADIIGVIDGIAFQTNILALNAAVEAARAGEQGRGFAVVAGEVRNLAQRSAAAAKEIKDLITDSVARVESGTAQVNQAGQTMEEIVRSVKEVTDITAEISAASREQSEGIEQVNQAVAQMDEITQQNAALVEEAAAAAESLQEQAEQLSRAVAVFRLDQTPGSHVAVTHPEPSRPAKKLHLVGGSDVEEWAEF